MKKSNDSGKKTVSRDEFVSRTAKRAGFTKGDTEEILKAMIEELKVSVMLDENVKITGLGKLTCRKILAHKGFDGINKVEMFVGDARRVNFKLSKSIRHPEANNILVDDDDDN